RAGDAMERVLWLRRSMTIALAGFAVAILGGTALAQQADKVPKPREVTLRTGDGVEIAAVYYESDRGKEAIPVILLHEYGGSGADFKGLAEHLQGEKEG